MAKVLKRDDAVDIENLDEGVANKWRWQEVEKTVDVDLLKYPKITRSDTITICLKDCIRKIDQCGKSICLLCRKADPMKYGTNGVAPLMKYVQSFGHVQTEVNSWLATRFLGQELRRTLKRTMETLPYFPIHLQLQHQQQQHLNQRCTSSIASATWKQWSVPFLLSVHFLFLWLSLWSWCVNNSPKILQFSKVCICSELLQGLFCLVFLRKTFFLNTSYWTFAGLIFLLNI